MLNGYEFHKTEMGIKVKLSLVVPCFNEENNVIPFFDAVKSAFDGKIESYEVIFVNDGSRDNTLKKLKELYSREKCARVISFSRNFGKEAAILAGLRSAVGEYTAIIDADLQQLPETVLEMVRILDEKPECDCVAAYQDKRRENPFLKISKFLFYKLMNGVCDVKLHADASDFRTFRKNMREAILSLPEKSRFSKGIFAWVGFNTEYLPYIAGKRFSGKSAWSIKKLFRYSMDGITDFSVSPLKIPTACGIFSVILAVIWFLVMLVMGRVTSFSGEIILDAILFLWGLSSVFIGIIGTYIAKNHTEIKDRPAYIIKECLNHDDEK